MYLILRRIMLCIMFGISASLLSAPSYAEMSKGEAAAQAKANHGGKVLSVDRVSSKNGKSTYKVKLLLSGGRVKTVTISG